MSCLLMHAGPVGALSHVMELALRAMDCSLRAPEKVKVISPTSC